MWGFIKGFGKLIIGFLLILQGLIGLSLLILLVAFLINVSGSISPDGRKASTEIEANSALLLNPTGVLVEETRDRDPFANAIPTPFGGGATAEVSVHQIVRAIRAAKDDARITGMVLDVSRLQVSSINESKLEYIAKALHEFRAAGKKVYATGDSYSQPQYLLASQADEVMLNPEGEVFLTGFGSYGVYYKSLFDRFKVTSHVFRVGTYKSAIEPYIRDDMSPAAKEANLAFLNALWSDYSGAVEKARGLTTGDLSRYVDQIDSIVSAAGGDMAEAAKRFGLVDSLATRQAQTDYLIKAFGQAKSDKHTYRNVSFARYFETLDPPKDGDAPNIAVVTAAGTIVDGEAPVGAAGGDRIARLLRQARMDDNVKAVVLRVDSPGGSAFASEIIRQQVLELKKAGKPVIVSMGSLAASGGYWISASADEIWSAPSTLTGSIGIFGYFQTYENAVGEYGVHTDGVGTSDISAINAAGLGPLPEKFSKVMQAQIEHGYDRFISIVGEGRKLEKPYVDSIAQGHVWIGERANELRLVDHLGDYDDAIAAAAKRAGLETYDVVQIGDKLSAFERFLRSIGAEAQALAPSVFGGVELSAASPAGKLLAGVGEELRFQAEFNDPNAVYVRCVECELD